jgi:NADH-quinone oxidoreductase subunit G
MLIGTFIEHSIDHELSGNIIDLCPVGALNSKPYRFQARAWEMTQHPLVSPHDGFGTQLYGHVLRGRLMRVVPRPCEELNETWIADRDRFSYEGIYSAERLQVPRVRLGDGRWHDTDWDTALAAMATGMQAAGAGGLGLLAHPSSTLEEFYLLGRIANGLGTANLDHRLRQRDFRDQGSDPALPGLGLPLAEVDALDALFIIGSNLRAELPMLAHRVRKAARRGARVSLLNPAEFEYLFPVDTALLATPSQMLPLLAGVLVAALEALEQRPAPELKALLAGVRASDAQRAVAATLTAGRRAIWLGALALRHSAYADLRSLARELARVTGAQLGELVEGANGAGACLAGCLPHRDSAGAVRPASGLNARQMLEQPLAGYLLLGAEPWVDGVQPLAFATLQRARFVGAVTAFASPQLLQFAQVLLPAATFAETSGTYVNLEGRWQSFTAAARTPGSARPGWKILRVLGNLLGLAGFDYQSSDQVCDELRGAVEAAPRVGYAGGHVPSLASSVEALREVPMYQVDPIVVRAPSLQQTRVGRATPTEYAP